MCLIDLVVVIRVPLTSEVIPPPQSAEVSSSSHSRAGASAAIATAMNASASAAQASPLLLDARNEPIMDMICREHVTQQDLHDNNVETLGCGHMFHKSCINEVRGTDYRGVAKPYVACPVDRVHHVYDQDAYDRLNPSQGAAPRVSEQASSALAAAGARDFTTSWRAFGSSR